MERQHDPRDHSDRNGIVSTSGVVEDGSGITRTFRIADRQQTGQFHIDTGNPDRLDDVQSEYSSNKGWWIIHVDFASSRGIGRTQENDGLGKGNVELLLRVKHG